MHTSVLVVVSQAHRYGPSQTAVCPQVSPSAQQLATTRSFGTRLNLVSRLEGLSGVGPYTARAVAAFAYNEDVILVETNIRTAVMHHFFSGRSDVADAELVEVLKRLLPSGRSREWYSALMDYGAHLKKSGVKLNSKSKHHTKQSKFTGSLREARGAILRELSVKNMSESNLIGLCGQKRRPQMRTALSALVNEGLVEQRFRSYSLAG